MNADQLEAARALVEFARSHAALLRSGNMSEAERGVAEDLEERATMLEGYLDQ